MSDISKILSETFLAEGCGCIAVATCTELLRVQPCNKRGSHTLRPISWSKSELCVVVSSGHAHRGNRPHTCSVLR